MSDQMKQLEKTVEGLSNQLQKALALSGSRREARLTPIKGSLAFALEDAYDIF